MASEVEEYLDKFDATDSFAERIFEMSEKIGEVADLLAEDPQTALPAIPADWPTYDELRQLLLDFEKSRGELEVYWQTKLSDRIRTAISHKSPDKAGQQRLTIPD